MTIDTIISQLLSNRGLTSPKSIAGFFSPISPADIPSPFDSTPAINLIKAHLEAHHKIAIYGDYDVDGITSTAILWETLYPLSSDVFPHIPHRRDEGYGLSEKGLDHCLQQGAKLIIAVDNGIVAHKAVEYCKQAGCDLIIIDHHEPGASLPPADVILHSTATCAAGLTWFFCRDFLSSFSPSLRLREGLRGELLTELLSLVAIAVVCDLVPLLGINRSFVKYGLVELNRTTRPGLLALFSESGLTSTSTSSNSPSLKLREGAGGELLQPITAYHLGFVIGPRLNSMGRLSHAIDSLRLLCTTDPARAQILAATLGTTNRTRQDLTQAAFDHALARIDSVNLPRLFVAADSSYDEGVIGLIAAKLVEKFYRPALAISVGEKFSKGSARSIPGFNITDHLRSVSSLLIEVGGHAMAAGFSLDTANLDQFVSAVTKPNISPELLVKTARIDAKIPLFLIDIDFYHRLADFAPFGLGNPQPVFSSPLVEISSPRHIGKSLQHLKFYAGPFDAIYFNAPPDLHLSTTADLTYSLDLNTYNGRTNLQLIVKHLSATT